MAQNKDSILRSLCLTLASLLAGGLGGILQDAVYYPFETIKSRIQVKDFDQASSPRINYMESAKKTSLFAGFSTILYVSFPATALYFLGYDGTKYYCAKYFPGLSAHLVSMAGGISAEVLCNAFRNPFEVIKQQMQVGLDPTVTQTGRNIYQAKGFIGNPI